LARPASSKDVDGFHDGPVGAGDVAVVGGVRPVAGEDAGCGRVVLAVPRHGAAEDVGGGEVEAAVPGEQGPDSGRAHIGAVVDGARAEGRGGGHERTGSGAWLLHVLL
jgi:hypothetical protein